MPRRNWNKIFVTGGTSFIGLHVIAALVDAGAEVTVLVLPENEDKLGALRRHVRLVSGDVWNPASLKGRSRGQGAVVHLVGSVRAQPERGLTFHQLNLVSARNTISMAVSDGVPYFVLLSAINNPPGVSSEYLRSKREAEEYLQGSGLRWAIIRAPVLFDRDQRGAGVVSGLSRIGSLPVVRVLTGRTSPLPVDVAARGIAQVAMQQDLPRNQKIYAGDLRRVGKLKVKRERRPLFRRDPQERRFPHLDEEPPFGWMPGAPRQDDDES
jgi:NADH dehydrogenase